MCKTSCKSEAFIDTQYKDNSPAATVAHIKSILASHGIEVEELWRETSVPYCYALSGKVKGTTFYVNGKGLSKDLALASCYGEMMERLQLGYIYSGGLQKDGTHNDMAKTTVSVHELLEKNPRWYDMIVDRLKKLTGITSTPEKILGNMTEKDGTIAVSSFFCLTTGKEEYYSNNLRNRVYTSNGSAAGNSHEEAIVQAISEIVERHHMLQIIDGGISMPDIPEETLAQYKTAYRIITYIREKGYRVFVKDGSLGKNFPVVYICIIDEATGRYHTHVGSYPIFEIALERALTESFQGRTIDDIASYEDFLFKKPGEFSFASLSNEFVQGAHEKTTGFFVGEPKYQFDPQAGFKGADNKALLLECIEYFKEQGYDILVRDCSCLGFPTCQVIIPGYSEVFLHRAIPEMNEHRYAAHAVKALRNPSDVPVTDLLGMLMHLNEMENYTSNIYGVHGFLAASKLAAVTSPAENGYLMAAAKAYTYYTLGRYPETINCINTMLRHCSKEEADFLICLKRYLSLKINKYTGEEIERLITYFHRTETISKLRTCLQSHANPFHEFTLHCDGIHCDGCRLQHCCCQRYVTELSGLILQKTQELDFDQFKIQLSNILA